MKYTKELLEPIVKESISVSEVLRKLNLKQTGGNHYHISNRIKDFSIDKSHFLGQGWNKNGRSFNRYTKEMFIKNVLTINGTKMTSYKIKLKLYEFGIKKRICEKCGQDETWNGEKLNLQLDHINGNRRDNRIINLRILCPNCHTQTPTFSQRK